VKNWLFNSREITMRPPKTGRGRGGSKKRNFHMGGAQGGAD